MKIPMVVTILLAVIWFGMSGCSLSEMTQDQALEMFTKVGGIQKINQEAKIIFDLLGTNESKVLYGSVLTNYPALSALGKPLFIQAGTNGYSSRIEIPFGSHYRRNFIFIFDPNGPVEFPYASKCIQVATNCFVSK